MSGLAVAVALALSCAAHDRDAHAPRVPASITRLVIIGDSVAHGAGDERGHGLSTDLHAVNLGINGARTNDVIRLLHRSAAKAAIRACDAVVLSIGGNDLFGDQLSRFESLVWPSLMMDRTLARIDRVVVQIHRINPSSRVYLLGLYNPYRNTRLANFLDRQVAIWDSRLIARFAARPDVDVIRIADLFAYAPRLSSIDHFHPGRAGYALIAQRIAMTW